MAQNSKIEWTHHTFNPWWGCVKVSEACRNCYAEAFAKRVGKAVWGVKSRRRFFDAEHWAAPLKWNAKVAAGASERVFCASMADVFERLAAVHPDADNMSRARAQLWQLVLATPSLDWLLLTKRPENVCGAVPGSWLKAWPQNVWIGTTVEDQETADIRLPHLLTVPSRIRFVSCEPLIAPLTLAPQLGRTGVNWVIAGGESGAKARPTQTSWVRQLRDECLQAAVPFHFKQWGTWRPTDQGHQRLGKHAAGRDLDGRTWDGFPAHEPRRGTQLSWGGALG